MSGHERRTTLFQGDAVGPRFRRTAGPWPDVAWVAVQPVDPARSVIRAGLVNGHTVTIEVPTVDGNRPAWALAQSGRRIPLRFEATRANPPHDPRVHG